MNKCSSHHVYNASAYGFAAELERPTRHSIPTQAGAVLAASGGRGVGRIHGFKFDGVISVEDAYSEVGGSYDDSHNLHTTYAFSVLEGVNIADVLTADRIVSRLSIYVSADPKKDSEPRFDITGSHFENLKIAGHKVDVKLATDVFHKLQKYSEIVAGNRDEWLVGSKLGALGDEALKELEHDYHGLSDLVKAWKKKGERPQDEGILFSPANHLRLQEHGVSPEVLGFGNMIFVPKFGVIRLAELVVHKRCRSLTMFHIYMCSVGTGGTSGGGTGGSGGSGTSGG